MSINVIDLFAGVGGLSYGFSHTFSDFFNIVFANELDTDIAAAYKLNNPTIDMLNCDIKKIDESFLNQRLKNTHIHLIIGGPPCQSYSTLGKRTMDDRANLFMEYWRILSAVKPDVFVFENVVGILSMESNKLFPAITSRFTEIGYNLQTKVLNAVDYGVPQYRERVILVGTRKLNRFEYPSPSFFSSQLLGNPYRTVSDALSNLPRLNSGDISPKCASNPLNNYQTFLQDTNDLLDNNAPRNGPRLVELMKALPDGGSKKDLPNNLKPKSGYGNTYAKMWWDRPAPTITRNFATPSSSRCIHPRDSRALSTREGARLQSFPDSYKFYGSASKKNLEIGNAVPPLVSIKLAEQIKMFFSTAFN